MTHYVLPNTPARLDYDKETRSLYVAVSGPEVLDDFKLKPGARENIVDRTLQAAANVNIDFDADGNVVGVEVLLP